MMDNFFGTVLKPFSNGSHPLELEGTASKKQRRDAYNTLLIKLALALGFITLFNFCYQKTVPYYAYMGITYAPFNNMSLIIANLIAMFLVALVPVHFKKPSDIILFLMTMIVGAPSVLVGAYLGLLKGSDIYIFQGLIVLFFVTLRGMQSLPDIRISTIRDSQLFFFLICVALSVSTILMLATYPIPTEFLSLLDVYGTRTTYSNITSDKGLFVFYLFAFQTNVINILLLCYCLEKKSKLGAFLVMGLQLYLYLITGSKFFFFVIIIAPLAILVFNRVKARFILYSFAGFALLSLGGVILAQFDFIYLLSFFFRRLMVVPAQLSVYYYDFFHDRPFVMLSSSFPNVLKPYEYALELPKLIGGHYLNNPETNANVNMVMDAFTQFGIYGIFGYAILTGGIMKFFDSMRHKKSPYVLISGCIVTGLLLSATGLNTALLTHGVLMFMLMTYLYPNSKSVKH
jgi:hypothetical protein